MKDHRDARRSAARWIELALLVCALICLGLFLRGLLRDARQLKYEQDMRDEIRRYSTQEAAMPDSRQVTEEEPR